MRQERWGVLSLPSPLGVSISTVMYYIKGFNWERSILFAVGLFCFISFAVTAGYAQVADSMLRIGCDDSAAGAEITINGVFKGECPLDIQVEAGTLKIQVVKKVDALHERVFEQEVRMGAGTVKRVDVVLSAPRLNAAAAAKHEAAQGYFNTALKQQGAEALQSLQLAQDADPDNLKIYDLRAQLAAMGDSIEALQNAIKDLVRFNHAQPKMLASLPQMTQWLGKPAFKEFLTEILGRKKVGQLRQLALTPAVDGQWVNSLGMKFVPVPGTQVSFCIWDVRVQDYREYAQANTGVDKSWEQPSFSGFTQGGDHPVVNVSRADAQAFCAWLTKLERADGTISETQSYRLPADWEWSVAVGLSEVKTGCPGDKDSKITGEYPWGASWPPPSGAGNYNASLSVDSFPYTSPVGSFAANKFGLYDMGGNVSQRCEDYYDGRRGEGVLRGASWFDDESRYLLSSCREVISVDSRHFAIGFRCVLVVGESVAR